MPGLKTISQWQIDVCRFGFDGWLIHLTVIVFMQIKRKVDIMI